MLHLETAYLNVTYTASPLTEFQSLSALASILGVECLLHSDLRIMFVTVVLRNREGFHSGLGAALYIPILTAEPSTAPQRN